MAEEPRGKSGGRPPKPPENGTGLSEALDAIINWWQATGTGKTAEAARKLNDRDRQIKCVEEGGTWDPDKRRCIKQ